MPRSDRLSTILAKLAKEIPFADITVPAISAGSVGWHLHHALLVINGVCNAAKASNPSNYKWKFNAMKTLILALRRIPRGRGKAPRSVQPDGVIGKEGLEQEFRIAAANISLLIALHPNAYFTHPFFGDLNRKTTIRFLQIHTQHHLDIVDDILRKNRGV